MGNVTIPRIMTENPDVIFIVKTLNLRQTENRRVKFRLALYASVTFYKRIAKQTNSSFFKKQSEVPWDHACVPLRTTKHVIRDLQENNMF